MLFRSLAPEMGISAVQRYGWGQEWRPSAKIGVSVDFNLTNHFGIESGLFYTFRGYSISNGGTYSNGKFTWTENVSQTRHFLQIPVLAQFRWTLNKNTKMFFLHKKIPFPIRYITDLCNCYTYIVPYLKGDV